jgi:hypothetical protein
VGRFRITILPAALTLAAAVFVPTLSAARAAGPGPHHAATATAGQRMWVSRYHPRAFPADGATDAVRSPDGTKVFVTGYSIGHEGSAFATIAYRPSTGARLWVARYPAGGRFFSGGSPHSIAVSPDGTLVFVTGQRVNADGRTDYATVAYRAATGAQVWAARYNGPSGGEDSAVSVAVGPHGKMVFVTGSSRTQGAGPTNDFATLAYRAATGTRVWARRYSAAANSNDQANALAVSPNGRLIFVTGETYRRGAGADYLTVAYRAGTGALQWHARYNGPGNGEDTASSVVVLPDSKTVLVTGSSEARRAASSDWATIAYRAGNGTRRWVSRYNGPGNGYDAASSMAVGPRGTLVYVTGSGTGKTSGEDCTTIAYRTATGARAWLQRFSGPGTGPDRANSVATSPDGSKVFITGLVSTKAADGDYLTIGYRAATGARLWSRRYNGPASSLDEANTVVTTARRVIVTGTSFRILGNPGSSDYATIAYKP